MSTLWAYPKAFGMQDKKKLSGEVDIGITLGRAIAAQRKALGLSQNDLAGMIEVDAETISRFERGAVLPSLRRLLRVAAALQVSLVELLSQSRQLPDDQRQKLLMMMQDVNEKDQQLLLDFANLLRNR